MSFQVGSRVTWTSQSQGSAKTKTGTVVEVLPAHTAPDRTRWPQLWTGAGPGFGRNHETYIVQADKRIYWPRVKQLQAAPEGL